MKIVPPPGPARTRQLAMLGLAMLALAYTWTRVVGGGPASPAGTATTPAARSQPSSNTSKAPPSAPAVAARKTMPEPVELGKLQETAPPSETTRNPFRFGARPAPPPPPAREPPPKPVVPPGPPPPPPIPPIALKFIGRLVVGSQIVAVLSDSKGTVFNAVEGQIVDGRYRVVKIGSESLVIEYVDAPPNDASTALKLG